MINLVTFLEYIAFQDDDIIRIVNAEDDEIIFEGEPLVDLMNDSLNAKYELDECMFDKDDELYVFKVYKKRGD